MHELGRQLWTATRSLGRKPGFTAIVVLTLALGIGANTAVFSVVNALLLRQMPAADLDTLVAVFTTDRRGEPLTSSYLDAQDLASLDDVFSGAAAHRMFWVGYAEPGGNRIVPCEFAAANYFSVLGVQPALGRTFRPEEDKVGAEPVAVVSHAFWRQRLAAEAAVLGRTLTINGRQVRVVGVAPSSFRGPITGIAIDLWLPLTSQATLLPGGGQELEQRGSRSLAVHARLLPGVTLAAARARVASLSERLAKEYPDSNRDRSFTVLPAGSVHFVPMVDRMMAPIAALLLLLPTLVLLVACSNVGSLLLAHAAARRREIAVRASLGANRRRLATLLLGESAMLALAGTVLGGLVAWAGVRALLAFQPPLPVPITLEVPLDLRVLGFALAVSLLTLIVFGLAPARRAAQTQVVAALRGEEAALGSGRRLTMRRVLVGVQVAASVLMLLGAGWFIRSLGRAQDVDPGFEVEHALVLTPGLMFTHRSPAESRALLDTLATRVAVLPGVRTVGLASRLPLGAGVSTVDFYLEGQPADPRTAPEVDFTSVGPGTLDALGIPVLRGRGIDATDTESSARVAVVSEAMARRFWPDREALGQRFRTHPDGDPIEVVGVVRDLKVRTLGETPRPYVILPLAQDRFEIVSLVARTAGDPRPLVEAARRELESLDRTLPVMEARPMAEYLSLSLFPTRLAVSLLSAFGALGLGLACLGLYGLVSHAAAQRSREIAIRMAMGSTAGKVLSLVAREGLGLVLGGALAGLVLAAVVAGPVSRLLVGVSPFDPLSLLGLLAVLAGTAVAACLVPARRASRVDPMTVLRAE